MDFKGFFFWMKKGKAKKKDAVWERKEHKREFIDSLVRIRQELTEKNADDKGREFFALVHKGLKDVLGLKYNATYSEMRSEVQDKKFKKEVKNRLSSLVAELEQAEYDFPELLEELQRKQDIREKLAGYVKAVSVKRKRIKKELDREVDDWVEEKKVVSKKDVLSQYANRIIRIVEGLE